MDERVLRFGFGLLLGCLPLAVQAAGLVRFTPQGTMTRITEVQAEFDAPVVSLGNVAARDPYAIRCDDKNARGSGRWVDPRHWVFTFGQPLGGAVACQAVPDPSFRDLDGQPVAGMRVQAFTTGGPRATLTHPWGDQITEDQVFAVHFDVTVDPQSVLARSHCEVQGLGESVAVRLIAGEVRERTLDALGWGKDDAARAGILLLQCKRMLPSRARVRFVVGPGVRTPATAQAPGVAGSTMLVRDFRVREPFSASTSCTRTNAQAPCSPLFPVEVNFSSPVPPDQAARIVLQTAAGSVRATELDARDATAGNALGRLTFPPPFAEKSTLTLSMPADLHDDAGRNLHNAAAFPLAIAMDAMPPLVKFASGPFGIVERFAEAPAGSGQAAVVPLSLRRVGPALHTRELGLSAGTVTDRVTTDDAMALRWYARVRRLQEGLLTPGQFADVLSLRPMRERQADDHEIDVRSRSIFDARDDARSLSLPGLDALEGPDIEVVGVPLVQPGLHVVEVASPRLGAALLHREGVAGDDTMYVRSAVLVTNLAVHFKAGRDDALVWVTSLDGAQPVAGARVAVLDCDGTLQRTGTTDAQGLWHSNEPLDTRHYCAGSAQSGVFVTARISADHLMAHGQADFSFTWSDWTRGIESWRFDVPVSHAATPDWVAHAVMDRTLLRVGETVSMKIFLRELTRAGVSDPQAGCAAGSPGRCLPRSVQIVHDGSGDVVERPVHWQRTGAGGVYALLDYTIPDTAHLGGYAVRLNPPLPAPSAAAGAGGSGAEGRWMPLLDAGDFRVESFRLPMLTGSLKIDGPLVAPSVVRADLQLDWQAGGPAQGLGVSLSAMAQPAWPAFDGYEDYVFDAADDSRSEAGEVPPESLRRLILDKQAVHLDARGGARVTLDDLPAVSRPQSWLFEASFTDPNGEIQTISQSAQVWPAAVVVGIRSDGGFERGEKSVVKLVVLDTAGKPQPDAPVRLDARVRTYYSTRKRLVGGFYAYDSHVQVAPLGTLCEGRTDARGQLECAVTLNHDGEIQLLARARDAQGRESSASTSAWVWGGPAWFGGGNDDRIDVVPDRLHYRPGETAELTVRMPFRKAKALVAVEREGVLETQVVDLEGNRPVVHLPVREHWGPNVYVSVLVLRGRVRQVPWASFLQWGWKHPVAWARARADQSDDAPAPGTLVDLARPAFRFGLAQIRVSDESDRLKVDVRADRDVYQVRETARVEIQARLPDGTPAAGATVAFAAVDEALLELRDNASWNLLDAMRVRRDYGVETATSLGQVVGRRHYGRKAVPAGGGGGFAPTRELFDTLLLWRGDLVLDQDGRARVQVPLNDSLTRFRLVAVVAHGVGRFGTGSTDITSTQDLQVIAGLPRIVREEDRYEARATVRNRTSQALSLSLSGTCQPGCSAGDLAARRLDLAPGSSQTVGWPVAAPRLAGQAQAETLRWTFEARSQAPQVRADRVVMEQRLLPAVPVTVRQATLVQLASDVPQRLPVEVPQAALADAAGVPRGGVRLALQSSLAGALPGVHDWLAAYPFTCMEQLSSKAVGMQDPGAWDALMKRLATYQAASGLVSFFPGGRGSVVLTAQLLEVTARARQLGWAYVLPAQAREKMLAALRDFVHGRLDDQAWAPVRDEGWRKLIAIDALALNGAWEADMLDTFSPVVDDWPTAAVVTWVSILQHATDLPQRPALLERADAVLRMRLQRHGTTLTLSEAGGETGWWLMSNVATAQARLLLSKLQQPQWREDLPRLLRGLLSLQQRGAWQTTTSNVLGVLAASAYARQAEAGAGKGMVDVVLEPARTAQGAAIGSVARTVQWAAMPERDGVRQATMDLPWPATRRGVLRLMQQGEGGGWATVSARAAIPQTEPLDAGLRVDRSVTAVSRARPDRWSVGDIYRVRLTIHSGEPVIWSVVSDPVPAGASILGGGLGRDSSIAVAGESEGLSSWIGPSFVERDADAYRAYFEVMRAGTQAVEYTVRINAAGTFRLPPTRVEALYQPDVSGSLPNAPFVVAGDP